MKSVLIFLALWLVSPVLGQNIVTNVDSAGLSLELDGTELDLISLNGANRIIEIQINDSLLIRIDGNTPASFMMINTNSPVSMGMELDPSGFWAVGEFAPFAGPRSVLNIRNGLFRPEPNTAALATGNRERLRIMPNGDIGIGTMDPLERLDIHGGLRVGPLIEDAALDRILVIDENGHVRYRPVATLPLPIGEIHALEEQNAVLQESLNKLDGRLRQLEERLASIGSPRN